MLFFLYKILGIHLKGLILFSLVDYVRKENNWVFRATNNRTL